MQRNHVNRAVVLILALAISFVFFAMIRQFLLMILLAGIFSALSRPSYKTLLRWFGGHSSLASATTLILLIALVVVPCGVLIGMITAQAIDVGNNVKPWVQKQIDDPNGLTSLIERLPYSEQIIANKQTILDKAGQAVTAVSTFFINRLSQVTLGTINFLFMTFILLYTMYFFLIDGDKLLDKILYYLPLGNEDEARLIERFNSVARATIKGTALIGIIQGTLGGIAFAFVGIQGAVFWGAVMAVASVIPGVGSALVWVPATIILLAAGHIGKAIGLTLYCAIIVGGIDNILRPILVGKDTKMHELMILFSTMGGIFMFGFVGFIIGPIIAVLFVTMWDMYGVVYKDVLPPLKPTPTIIKEPKTRKRKKS